MVSIPLGKRHAKIQVMNDQFYYAEVKGTLLYLEYTEE